jgi:glycosyltransferase involved in cell wall biosynthesis
MSNEFPKVLIYSSEFPQTGCAGGILLDRLFRDYPRERVKIFGIAPHPASAPPRFDCRQIQMPWRRLEGSRFNRLHRTLRCYGLIPLMNPSEVDRMLGDFRPEVVLTVMQFGTWYDSAKHYAEARCLPLVAIIHDNNEGFEPVYPFAHRARRRRDGEFYRFASRRLCVSPEMEEEFRRRYGVHGEVMYPNRSEALRPRPLEECRKLKTAGRLTLGFVGNLNYGYGDQLLRMLPMLRETGALLITYGQGAGGAAEPLRKAGGELVDVRGFAPTPEEAWEAVQKECDALLFPYPDPAGFMEPMYAVHFPSKLPEYLGAGMPVIMSGPETATGVRWARRNPKAIHLLPRNRLETWAEELARLREDGNLRHELAAEAWRAGARDFDPVAIRRQFLSCLKEAAAGKS